MHDQKINNQPDSISVADAIREAIAAGYTTPEQIGASIGLPAGYVAEQLAQMQIEGAL